MRITEALKILYAAEKTSSPFPVALACGFTPLHLSTFLAAHLQQRLPNCKVEISVGLYGDLAGTLESLEQTSAHAIAIPLEWSDLDPRLGFRSAGPWGAAAIADILSQMPRVLQRLDAALERIPAAIPVALSTPTLPLPPLFHTQGWQAGEAELALDSMIAEFSRGLRDRANTILVNARRLAKDSPSGQRFDLKSELLTGFPYSTGHADAVASALARLMLPVTPKKGLITDLDNTLWSGIVGEVGPAGVSWDLASHTAFHALYQKLLAALAEEGVLIGVASKNESDAVAAAFRRDDILLPSTSVFPFEVHWHAKSGSVARILKRWNISADSVVFVDDNPMELAEVAAAHTGIECIQFPGKDYSTAGLEMLCRLRDLFGKARLADEDALRLSSIRNRVAFEESAGGETASEGFLRQLNSIVQFDFPDESPDPRALELVNKTNQFNLNGIRYTEPEWAKKRLLSNSFVAVVSYEDKFGPLGKIAVMQGSINHRSLKLDVWVLSCRAFARRIEHQCLRTLFDRFAVDSIELAFVRTDKNGPVFEFLRSIMATTSGHACIITRTQFEQSCPPLYHTVKEARRVEVNG